jgi:hypothetical protein
MGDGDIGARAGQSPTKAAKSSIIGSKLAAAASAPGPRDPPWPRQSKLVTFQPESCQCAHASRYFSMKSLRPLAKSRLPRGLRRPPAGQSIRRSVIPSGAVQPRMTAPFGCARLSIGSFTMTHGYGLESNAV